ncbi:MAG: UDP-2,4-diacetamido-2,4,6-trideoxy-beta-L-altropyranose hydrolase [Cycloclasticus sp.]
MLVVFRADASLDIGTGHVMRCLTLANQLKAMGDECLFICRALEGNLIEYLESEAMEVISLPESNQLENNVMPLNQPAHGSWLGVGWQQDAEETLQAIVGRDVDCLVVDHYALDVSWEQMLREKVRGIFVIDDLADRKHDCFALLDQNYGRKAGDYEGLLENECLRLIGPEFALLRPEFSVLRQFSLKRRAHYKLETILVNLGGVDQGNLTARIIDALSQLVFKNPVEFVVVLGSTNPNVLSVRQSAKMSCHNVSVKVGVNNMAELMASSDLAIGAAGSTTWERFSLGVPSILMSIAENQAPALNALAESRCIYKLSSETIVQDLNRFFEQSSIGEDLFSLSKKGRELCDALGAKKIEKIIRVECEG